MKSLIFAVPFLITFWLSFQRVNYLVTDPYLLLGINPQILFNLGIIGVLILLSSLFFTLMTLFSKSWKIVFPVILLACLSLLAIEVNLHTVLEAVLSFLVLSISSIFISQKMANYLTFQSGPIINPSIKQVSTLIVLIISLATFFVSYMEIKNNGFIIPESLIDQALSFTPRVEDSTSNEVVSTPIQPQLPTISQEQIEQLKKNPQLLRQFNIRPELLDSLAPPEAPVADSPPSPTINSDGIVRAALKTQLDLTIKPYQDFIPFILGITLFFSLQAIISLLSILLPIIVWVLFFLFEKLGLISYSTESREVKRLVV